MKAPLWLLILGLMCSMSPSVEASRIYPFKTTQQEAQFNHLLSELRCLVCQNQDVADSNAGLAKDFRAEVYNRVKAGESDAEIIDYLTDRYGDFILFKPRMKWMTAILWLGPFLFLGWGVIIFLRKSSR